MELIVLGANGTYPTPHGACSGYLVRHDGFTMWMDAGNGTLAKLQEHVDPFELGAIYLSHVHPDHCADMYPFFYLRLMDQDRDPLTVFAPPGTRAKLQNLIGEDSIKPFNRLLEWREIGPGAHLEAGPLRIDTFDASHSAPNNTARISAGGKILCFSGDTGPNENLAVAACDADLFLCEASWLEKDDGLMEPIHLRATQAGAVAKEAGAGRLALTHIWPHNDHDEAVSQASQLYDGPIAIAARTPHFEL